MQEHASPGITDAMISAAVSGDPFQREQLFACMAPIVRVMVNARLNPTLPQSHLSEDLVQEVTLSVSAALPTLQRRTVGGFRSFVSTIVSRRVADALREKGRHPRGVNGETGCPMRSLDSTVHAGRSTAGPIWAMLSASGVSPMSEANQCDLFGQVMQSLAELKEDHRTAITLAFFDQLETSDIAEKLGISRAAASMLVIRAVKALRRHLTGSSGIQSLNGNPQSVMGAMREPS